ncbi:MAG: tetratricopeptide repeat protein, partial [Pyrinomonadaceae bacterium]
GVKLYEELIAAAPENEKYQLGYATMLNFYGMLQTSTGDQVGAIASGRRSVTIFESLVAANPNNAKYETHLMAGLVFMRYPLVDEKLFDEALTNANRVIQTMEKQLAADPKNAFFKRSVGVSYNALGRIQTDMGNGAAAVENHRKALKIAEELYAADGESSENQRDLAMTLEFTADAEASTGDCSAAIESYRKALKSYGSSPGDDLAPSYSGLGKCLAEIGKLNEAVASFRQTVPLAEQVAIKSPLNVKKQARLAIYYLEGGKVLARLSAASGDENSAVTQEKDQWIEKGYRMLKDLEASGKLSKLNSKYLYDAEVEMKKLGRLT